MAGKARNGGHLGVPGIAFARYRHGGDEGDLVFRATPGFSTASFTAQVGVVDLDRPLQAVAGLAFGHGLHQLVVHQPGRAVTDAEEPLQLQAGQPGLGATDEIDGQKPDPQGQVAVVEQGPGGQGGLFATGGTLKHQAPLDPEPAVAGFPASGTAEAFRPAGRLQGRFALGLGAKVFEKIRQGEARLELNAVHRHCGVFYTRDIL